MKEINENSGIFLSFSGSYSVSSACRCLAFRSYSLIGLPMPRCWKRTREAAKAQRREAWQNTPPGQTPDIVRKKALKRQEQRARAQGRTASSSTEVPEQSRSHHSNDDRSLESEPGGAASSPPSDPSSEIKVELVVYGQKYHGHRGHTDYDHYMDCTWFHDPARDTSLQSHTGLHETMILRMEQHQDFDWYLKSLARFLHSVEGDEIRIGIFCKAGRHRSVSMSFLVSRALQLLNCKVEVIYVEKYANHWNALCTQCPFCADTEQKEMCAERTRNRLLEYLKEEDPDTSHE